MKEKIAKLIDVKSIMTLMLTVVFCVLALLGVISGQEFITIFTVIVGFYFGTQSMKKAETDKVVTEYTGPTEGAVVVDTAMGEPMDAAVYNETHPNEADSNGDVVVTGFGG